MKLGRGDFCCEGIWGAVGCWRSFQEEVGAGRGLEGRRPRPGLPP